MTYASPTVTTVFVGPRDLPYWVYDGSDAREYLTILDSVGDFVLPQAPTTHIAPALLGPWGMYQLLGGHVPPGDAAPALAWFAREMGQDLLADRLDAALPVIEAALADEFACEDALRSAATGAWATQPDAAGVLEHRVAQWVEAHLPRQFCDSDATLQEIIRDVWAATDLAHPLVGEVRNGDRLARERVLALMKTRKAAAAGRQD
jgi:hypothetical protein